MKVTGRPNVHRLQVDFPLAEGLEVERKIREIIAASRTSPAHVRREVMRAGLASVLLETCNFNLGEDE